MNPDKTIIVTGAAGFIGSCMVNKLNNKGFHKIVLVDDFTKTYKKKNLTAKVFTTQVDRNQFWDYIESAHDEVGIVIHLGARTDTTEMDKSVFDVLNLNYSKKMWEACTKHGIPLIYASSAATYGAGENGYSDDHDTIPSLRPLNPYGESKNDFDNWVLNQNLTPPFWAGIKFFNVYGPNEYHKGRMASVVFHAFKQIESQGYLNLFRSHNSDYRDGEQLRDFIYVKDVVDVLFYLMLTKPSDGIYNLGTGKARTFIDLGKAVFSALELESQIRFIDTPIDIRDKYQYFTEADMTKLRGIGYSNPFTELEAAISDYVLTYLSTGLYY